MLGVLTRFWVVMVILQMVSSNDYCGLKCPLFDPPRGAVYLPGPTKQHYYKCSYGVGILFMCRRGKHFNPRKRRCEKPRHAHAVECLVSPNHENEGSGDDGFYLRTY